MTQRFELEAHRLLVTLELAADEPMPASMGWHPWFRRRLDQGGRSPCGSIRAGCTSATETGSRPAG